MAIFTNYFESLIGHVNIYLPNISSILFARSTIFTFLSAFTTLLQLGCSGHSFSQASNMQIRKFNPSCSSFNIFNLENGTPKEHPSTNQSDSGISFKSPSNLVSVTTESGVNYNKYQDIVYKINFSYIFKNIVRHSVLRPHYFFSKCVYLSQASAHAHVPYFK